MAKRKVYICFEFDKDKSLKDLLVGQSRNKETPFDVIDGSLKEAAPEKNWEEKAARRIEKAEIVIVLLGATTHRAPGVAKEIAIALGMKKKVVQIIGYKGGQYKRIHGAGRLYRWTWDNLKKILQ